MGDQANFLRGTRFRSLVASVLAAYNVTATEKPRKLKDRLAAEEPQLADVLTNDFAAVTSHTARQRQWSGLLDQAERAAVADRRHFGVAIIARPDRDVRSQYALLSFGTLLDLMSNGVNPQRDES